MRPLVERIQFLLEGESYSKGSTQVTLFGQQGFPFLKFVCDLPDDILAEDGRELAPHITVLYGLTEDDHQPVVDACAKIGPISVTLGAISAFEQPDGDVLKVSVEGDSIHEANRVLRETVKYQNDYPDYVPHLTLAYLKKGAAAKYVGQTPFKGITLEFDTLTHCLKDGSKLSTPLRS